MPIKIVFCSVICLVISNLFPFVFASLSCSHLFSLRFAEDTWEELSQSGCRLRNRDRLHNQNLFDWKVQNNGEFLFTHLYTNAYRYVYGMIATICSLLRLFCKYDGFVCAFTVYSCIYCSLFKLYSIFSYIISNKISAFVAYSLIHAPETA